MPMNQHLFNPPQVPDQQQFLNNMSNQLLNHSNLPSQPFNNVPNQLLNHSNLPSQPFNNMPNQLLNNLPNQQLKLMPH
jgi:hypothetical protein